MAFVVFFAATFSVAPMAFCFVKVETPVPVCCPHPAHQAPHSDSKQSDCPICKYQYCKLVPTPVLKTSVPAPTVAKAIVTAVNPVAETLPVYINSISQLHFFDNSPPVYLVVCTFRI